MKKLLSMILISSFLLVSCYTADTKLEEGTPKEIYFKKAQEYMAYSWYQEAIKTYELFIERFPEDTEGVYTARYEIAFIYYKDKKYTKAQDEFLELLSVPSGAPEWIPVLSTRILEEISKKIKPKKAKEKKEKSNKENKKQSNTLKEELTEEKPSEESPEESEGLEIVNDQLQSDSERIFEPFDGIDPNSPVEFFEPPATIEGPIEESEPNQPIFGF